METCTREPQAVLHSEDLEQNAFVGASWDLLWARQALSGLRLKLRKEGKDRKSVRKIKGRGKRTRKSKIGSCGETG